MQFGFRGDFFEMRSPKKQRTHLLEWIRRKGLLRYILE